ncbi:hypothetical protein ACE6H2_007870 [Prunus campanulata]
MSFSFTSALGTLLSHALSTSYNRPSAPLSSFGACDLFTSPQMIRHLPSTFGTPCIIWRVRCLHIPPMIRHLPSAFGTPCIIRRVRCLKPSAFSLQPSACSLRYSSSSP